MVAEATEFDANSGEETRLGTLVANTWRDGTPEQLVKRLRDVTLSQSQRFRAAESLGQYGHDAAQAVPALIEVLNADPDNAVRAAAARALGTVGESGKRAIPDLIRTLQSGPYKTHYAAAFALSKIGDARALPALRAALRDAPPDVQRWAREAITRIEKEQQ